MGGAQWGVAAGVYEAPSDSVSTPMAPLYRTRQSHRSLSLCLVTRRNQLVCVCVCVCVCCCAALVLCCAALLLFQLSCLSSVMLKAACLLLLSLAATVGIAAAGAGSSAGLGPLPSVCSGSVNSVPLVSYDASTAVKIASVTNGTLSSVMPAGATTPLLVLHLYGDSYSMGVAYGQLLAEQLSMQIPRMYEYFTSKYGLSPALMNDLLDLTRNSTKAFTPAWHFEFMQGVSDGTKGNTTFLDFWRIAMVPEAIKAACSITGAWGGATATGGLLQLRALDWGTDGPFQEFPLLATFHPDDGSFTHSSLGWVGLYGTITGYSASNMAVSEKVW